MQSHGQLVQSVGGTNSAEPVRFKELFEAVEAWIRPRGHHLVRQSFYDNVFACVLANGTRILVCQPFKESFDEEYLKAFSQEAGMEYRVHDTPPSHDGCIVLTLWFKKEY